MSPRILLNSVLVLAFTAAAIVVHEGMSRSETSPDAIAFQQLVGGLGLGAEMNLERCGAALDPRLNGGCYGLRDSLWDSHRFCPCHSFSLSPIATLANEAPSIRVLWHANLD